MGELLTMEINSNHPLYLHMDGELFTDFSTDIRNLKIEIIPQALEVIVPKDA
jgi:diacylglycerol kinase family enzyme